MYINANTKEKDNLVLYLLLDDYDIINAYVTWFEDIRSRW